MEIGRVADGDVEALASLQQRQHAMFGEKLLVDETNHVEVELDRIEIEQRHAELVGGGHSDLAGVAELLRHEVRDEARAFAAYLLERRQEALFGDDAVLNQAPR